MSTDMQTYSIENQSAAIAAYALGRGLEIVRTYVDAGKSGLSIDQRDALQELLGDVRSGRANFAHLLIFDVSRWGRFQDPDESAHYEFICRNEGITVHYCAEQFENDGSLIASIIKNLKRAMAAEFSRELSAKVFAGHARVVSKGFYVGSKAGYGLRRFLVDQHRNPKFELKRGDRKSIHSDKVILVPGAPEEVEVVRRVYDLFVVKGETLNEISRILNREGVKNNEGRPWQAPAVRELLSNEKYIGNLLYSRTSKKLKGSWRKNPPGKWVRVENAFEGIVTRETFAKAQEQLKRNASPYSDADLLNTLSAIWCAKGELKIEIFEAVKGAPSAHTYAARFGSLLDAYNLIGYKQPFLALRAPNCSVRKLVGRQVVEGVRSRGGKVEVVRGLARLRINGEFRVSIVVGRNRRRKNTKQWCVCHLGALKPDILIVPRVTPQNEIEDYFFLPSMFFPERRWIGLSGHTYEDFADFRFETLDPFFDLCARTHASNK